MKKPRNQLKRFAICVTDAEPDLEPRKVYQVLPDRAAARSQYLRVIDESGEDYLYPADYFILVRIPKAAAPTLVAQI
jgi:hypothetical protein